MMREAPPGFFEQEMHVSGRNAEKCRDNGCTQIRIAAAALDFAQNGGPPRRADAILSREIARHGSQRESRQINEMTADKLRSPPIGQIFGGDFLQISEQQLEAQVIGQFCSGPPSDPRREAAMLCRGIVNDQNCDADSARRLAGFALSIISASPAWMRLSHSSWVSLAEPCRQYWITMASLPSLTLFSRRVMRAGVMEIWATPTARPDVYPARRRTGWGPSVRYPRQ